MKRILIILLLLHRPLFADVPTQDSLALVALYDSTNGAGWTNHTDWLTGSVSDWFGIIVDQGRVISIQLRNNNLVGRIPPQIGNLTGLVMLDLFNNQLNGPIPGEIGNLVNLKDLNLSRNPLTGSIPAAIGQLINLQALSLGRSQLDGNIPPEIGNLIQLTYLFLSSNQHTGQIPEEVYNLSQLEFLYLRGNQLSGPLAPEIENLTNLLTLDLNTNYFTYPIPPEIGNLPNLTTLFLYNNQFSGNLPYEIGNLSNLQSFYVYSNQLDGPIPVEINQLPQLHTLYLSNNEFTDLPDLSPDTSLVELKIQNNNFTFEDIEPNVWVENFTYSPQKLVGELVDTTILHGSDLELSIIVGGTANQYQWTKDYVDIPGAVSSTYVIQAAEPTDAGLYHCRITNGIATELTLNSETITVTVSEATDVDENLSPKPVQFELYQNYPNPFNNQTVFSYQLPFAEHVSLNIYNTSGQMVMTLVNERKDGGFYAVHWDGKDNNGNILPTGVYTVHLQAGTLMKTGKTAFIK